MKLYGARRHASSQQPKPERPSADSRFQQTEAPSEPHDGSEGQGIALGALGLDGHVDAARLEGDVLAIRVDGLGAELRGAEEGGVGHFFPIQEVVEEREDVELREGGYVLRGEEAEDRLAGLLLAFVKGAVRGGNAKGVSQMVHKDRSSWED